VAKVWTLKQHDTWPNWEGQLQDENKQPIDLTNAASAKLMRVLTTGGSLQTLPLTFKTPRTSGFVVRDWQDGDNDVPGTFKCEVEVTLNDGSIMTAPNEGTYTMIVEADLG
jgi:hypothetical protein